MKLPKETTKVEAGGGGPHGRWYNDACGSAFALELVGERWSLLIVRELMFGGRRFGELRGDLPGISAKVLAERLGSLEHAGILQRRQLPPPASAQLYELTRWGYAAEPAIQALGRWAAGSPGHDMTLPLSPASFVLSLRTMFDPALAVGVALTGGLAIGADRFRVDVQQCRLTAERGIAERPDFTLTAAAAASLAAAVYGNVPLDRLDVRLGGDPGAAARFMALFALPPR